MGGLSAWLAATSHVRVGALGPELLGQPFDTESHQRPGREQVTFSLTDLAGDTAASIERQLADDRKRILVADCPPIRKGANPVDVS